ncbi:SulP family inorganic anion transporter [Elioraea sp.]|uniref:SulP family inorganic anion transporter n=1 Tax=Elioraea sp. TaxID=2185103 RepID=UPI0025BE0172|nr:SulP family inorganic anion transporter [Elioraea sp.]
MTRATEAGAGLHAGILAATQSLTHGMIAFAALGTAGVAFGMAAALAASALAGLSIALLGSSRPLMGNTSAATALIAGGLLAALEPSSFGHAIAMAMLLAGAAGLLMLAANRLAGVAALVPTPVAQGLGNAIALLVMIAQAPILLGAAPGEAAPWAAPVPGAMAVAALALLLMLRPLPGLPAPLVALAVASGLHHVLSDAGIATGPVVGIAPTVHTFVAGIAAATAGRPHALHIARVLPAALSLALLATIETMAAAAALREASGRRGDHHSDLRGAALGMLSSAVAGGMPTVGLMVPSMACWRAGGRGRAAQLWRLPVPLAVLLAGGALVAMLPFAALSGVLCGAVLRLIKVPPSPLSRAPGRARRAGDALVVLSVMATALAFGLVAAVGAGMLLAMVIFTASMAASPVRRVSRNPVGRSRIRRPAGQERALRDAGEAIALIALEGAIFFGSAEHALQRAEAERSAGAALLILDLTRVTRLDLSGGRRLIEICRVMPGRVLLAPLHPCSRVAMELEALGLLARLPPAAVFADLPAAVEAAEAIVLSAIEPDERAWPATPRAALEALGVPSSEVGPLLALCTEQHFAAGAPILRRDELADAAYLLLSGEVLISLPSIGARPATRLAVLVPGVLFGESALLGQMRRSADATARSAVRCLRLDAVAVDRLRSEAPQVAWHLMTTVARQLGVQVRAANATIDRLEE